MDTDTAIPEKNTEDDEKEESDKGDDEEGEEDAEGEEENGDGAEINIKDEDDSENENDGDDEESLNTNEFDNKTAVRKASTDKVGESTKRRGRKSRSISAIHSKTSGSTANGVSA